MPKCMVNVTSKITMLITLTIDRAGRLVLPKAVREKLQLAPGDSLELKTEGDRTVLRAARRSRMRKERGVWVFDSGQPLAPEAVRKMLHRVRSERERRVLEKAH